MGSRVAALKRVTGSAGFQPASCPMNKHRFAGKMPALRQALPTVYCAVRTLPRNSGCFGSLSKVCCSYCSRSGQSHRLPSAASAITSSQSLAIATQSLWMPRRVGASRATWINCSRLSTFHGWMKCHCHNEPSDSKCNHSLLSSTRRRSNWFPSRPARSPMTSCLC